MKFNPMHHLWLTLFVSLFCLSQGHQSFAQGNYVYRIDGPYPDYPGPYYIKIQVNFVQSSSNQWTTNWNLAEEADAALTTLNAAYNKHNIFFIPFENPSSCFNVNYEVFTTSLGIEEIRGTLQDSNIISNALNIYVNGDDPSNIVGYEYYVPNTFCRISGQRNGVLATRTEVLVHEVGHTFGLVHTFIGSDFNGCDEVPGSCGSNLPCWCCGDYVCDTPINTDDNIALDSLCSHPTIPAIIARNFMSLTTPETASCKDRFSPEQAKRMRIYLEDAPVLQAVQFGTINYPGTSPAARSGNIIVESGSELIIDSTLEMLPSAYILVKRGGTLTVNATITGACDQMWQGIIVEGNHFQSQIPANQGRVIVNAYGKIEHAKIGINVQNVNAVGEPSYSTGGGILKVSGGKFENNMVGIRFGPYVYSSGGGALVNHSRLFVPRFTITDDYRGGTVQPILLDLNGIVNLIMDYGQFVDNRTACTTSRANGIISNNAGFTLRGGKLEKLNIGISASNLVEGSGSFSITGVNFINCFSELLSLSTNGFNVTDNNFTLGRPAPCSPTTSEIIGARLMGNTTGFSFTRNNFEFSDTTTLLETLIGVECQDLKEGMQNKVTKNTYTDLHIGNRAKGINSGGSDGLRFLCNTHDGSNILTNGIKIPSGSIRAIQSGGLGSEAIKIATGNIFVSNDTSILNSGNHIDYYYYDGDPAQDPADAASGYSISTVFAIDVSLANNVDCSSEDPCNPCDELVSDEWKTDFSEKRSEWLDETAALLHITDSLQLVQKKEEIKNLRLEMNHYGEKVIRNYNQDTVIIQLDSIVHWLQLAQTYVTDQRLARHYFFTDSFSLFQQLWLQIEQNYDLNDAAASEFDRLDDIYDTLQTYRQNGGNYYSIPPSIIDYLEYMAQTCDEAGYMSMALLWRNGIRNQVNCTETEERNKAHRVTDKIRSTSRLYAFPNPAKETLNITYNNQITSGYLKIFDIYGRVVGETNFNGNIVTVNVGQFPTGVYCFKLYGGNTFIDQTKVVISK